MDHENKANGAVNAATVDSIHKAASCGKGIK